MKTVWSCSRPAWMFGTLVRDSQMMLERWVGGDEQMGDFGMERVPGEECRGPVRVVVVQRAVVFLGVG